MNMQAKHLLSYGPRILCAALFVLGSANADAPKLSEADTLVDECLHYRYFYHNGYMIECGGEWDRYDIDTGIRVESELGRYIDNIAKHPPSWTKYSCHETIRSWYYAEAFRYKAKVKLLQDLKQEK